MSDRTSAPPMQRRGGPRPPEQRALRRGPPPPILDETSPTGATRAENPPRTGRTRSNKESEKTGSCSKDTGTGVTTPSFAKGGKVRRTGKIKAHKGEVVLPIKLVQKLKKLMV